MNQQPNTNKLASYITTGLFAGILAAAVNICYMFLYESLTGYSNPEYLNVLSIAIASIVPGSFAGLLLYGLDGGKSNKKGENTFLIVVIAVALISFLLPLNDSLPDGSPMPPELAGLTVPMHILAPLIYTIFLFKRLKK